MVNQTQLGLGALLIVLAVIGARIVVCAWASDRDDKQPGGRHRAPKKAGRK